MLASNLYNINLIAKILKAKAHLHNSEIVIKKLLTDTRLITEPESSLFFAIKAQRDGHDFIEHAYENGIRNFVVTKGYSTKYQDANFLIVEDVLKALQDLAIYNRNKHDLKVIGITGSNGKTIVKEWLNQLLASDFNIVRSPKSFNSQIGVPLSVWQINDDHDLGIFEAGISKAGEMKALANIIKPTIGILTNIGEAHAEGFASKAEKLIEKLKLFKDADLFIYAPEYVNNIDFLELPGKKKFTWSLNQEADLQVIAVNQTTGRSRLEAIYQQEKIYCSIPFTDKASIENVIICWATLLALGYTTDEITSRLANLTQVSMRLQLLNGIENCSVIDDSYSADISSLSIALDFLNLQNQHPKRTLILSDIYESGKANKDLYREVADLLVQKKVNRLIGIGPNISLHADLFQLEKSFYQSTADFIAQFPTLHFAKETILIKGARKFEFERISKLFTQKIHDTVLEINLNALVANLQFYKSKLQPNVKVMAMVKAFSYGSGSFEIANLLQFHKVDYLAVAYVDEGIALRKAGITLPIMVMSPEPAAFEAMLKYNLEPEIYNISILKSLVNFLSDHQDQFPIHLKLDTGMHRLGFEADDIFELLMLLNENNQIKVISIFTHLVASDDAQHDDFTNKQFTIFKSLYQQITRELNYQPLQHVLNTSGITRWPMAQLDMVRIGIGLYGFDSALNNKALQTVVVLKTTITQIKQLKAGETVGYSRKGILNKDGKIATVKIGYADGYNRNFGNGVGKMLINGKLVPTIGSICMDMTMLDVTNVDVKVGDEVIVFNDKHTIADLAKQINTIPYEILTNVSQRVKRIYFYE